MKRKSLLFFLLAAMFLPLAMNAQTSLFSEGFEGGSMPTGWTTDGSGSWSVATAVNSSHPSSAGEGTYCAQIKHGTTGATTKLITPEIDLSSVNSAELSFMHVEQSWSGDIDGLKVYYRTSSSGTWTQLVEYTDAYASWTTESGIVLPNPSNTYQIAFEYIDNYGYGLGIDDINIVPGASCPAPAGLAVTNNGQSATLTWTSDATQFAVAHSLDASADPSDNVVTTVSTNTYTMNDLALDQDHYFWVRANCSATDQSAWAGPVSVHIGYCVPAPTSVDNNGISNVTFGMGDYIVNNDTPKATYADYHTQIGAVQAGVEATIAITFATGYSYNTYVWVDLDNSLSFDANEVVCYGESASSNPTTLTLNFTIPADQTLGDFRMRIGSADSGLGSNPAAADPCYSSSYGCFQDYTLRVLEAPACMIPTGLALTTDGSTVTATWEGTAANYNIDINGTVYNNVTTPYEFDAELSTTYTVKVQANCDGGEISEWSNPVSITTPACIGGHEIQYTLNDSFGDGWNGNAIQVVEGCDIVETLTITSGSSATGTLTLCGDYYEFVWVMGNYPGETSFTFTEGGTTLFTKPSSVSDGQVLYTLGTQSCAKPTGLAAGTPANTSVELSWTSDASAWQICINNDEANLVDADSNPFTLTNLTPDTEYSVKVRAICGKDEQSCWTDAITFTTAVACATPTGLAEANITTNSADLSWTGTADSYVLQYRPWVPAGEDIVATGTMTTKTVDLSQYEGTGSVAIRHYDVSDMFRLNVDDIVVTNAAGTVIFSENFESGVMPSTFNNMDLDGDGYVWEIVSNGTDSQGNPTGNGNYCMASASYINNVGALEPDNWIIMSGLEMGGQISFAYRGQDPSFAAENFAIYVSTDNSVVEVPVTGTSYQLTDLTPNTPYAWQVKADCGDYQSNWVSSFFKTKDDMMVFATDGNWNDVANWEDAEGNAATALPTADNNVRIDADAIVPAGEIAIANKVTIGEGSILIKDGGQLKQNAATVRVTMEKEITGYGETDGNYYFISSPFNGRTLYSASGTWSYVNNLFDGEYDLYAFDATHELEWINYKSSPSHSAFVSDNDNAGLMYGLGYLYANQEGTTLEFIGTTGKSVNYTETKDFTYDGQSGFNGWALVGNFFSCNAYINYIDADGNVLDADFYTLNNDNTYSLMSSNQPLPPCTGSFINYSATGKVQFATEAPAGKNSGMINMTLSRNNKNVDQARVRFGQGHNLQHMSFRDNSRLYMNVDGNDYAVVYTENQGEMPVSFRAAENGTYTLSFNTEDVIFGYLHLIDNLTGKDVDLLSTPNYSFEASTTDYASRFKLVFATGNADDTFAFFSNGSFVINNEGNATLQVIDINGRILSSESINGCANVNVNAAPGVYMIRLVNGDSVKVQKVVVR